MKKKTKLMELYLIALLKHNVLAKFLKIMIRNLGFCSTQLE